MKAFVEVLCPGNVDSGSAAHLFIDGTRLQFGCGDGAQRTAVEAGVKPSRLVAIFLPSLCPRDVGGLPGMLLTASDAGMTHIVVAGPVGLGALLEAARPFFMRPSLHVNVEEVSGAELRVVFRKDTVSVRGVALAGGAVAFVARINDLPGRFDPAKAAALGVPRGRLYGVLQNGVPVTLESGIEVQPAQVMGAPIPGPVIAAIPHVDTPTCVTDCAHLSAAALETGDGRVSLVVHFSGNPVLSNDKYKSWTRALGSKTRHMPLHPDFAPNRAIFYANAVEISMLHYTIDEEIFPLPANTTRPHQPPANPHLDPVPERASHPPPMRALPETWLRPEIQLRLHLAPATMAGKLDLSNVPDALVPRNPSAPRRPWGRDLHVETSGATGPENKGSSSTSAPPPLSMAHLRDSKAEVLFLGTGGALPGKHRNVSAIHVSVASRGGLLLDCGEGTYGQLWRALGEEGARSALAQLRVMFISHMHADHHLGALRVLTERSQHSTNSKVAVVAPIQFKAWLDTALMSEARNGVSFFNAAELTDPQTPAARFFADSIGLELGTVRVLHCPDAFAIVLRDVVERWKLVYSGDTRPCDALVDAGSGATLLIHEATLDDRLRDEARAKMHTTVGEALSVAARMGAWRTVLTHFSQRYPKVPALDDDIVQRMDEVCATIACDFMRVPFSRLEEIPALTPVIRDAFEKDVEDLLLKTPLPAEPEVT